MQKQFCAVVLNVIITLPLFADKLINDALLRSLSHKNFPLAIALYQEAINEHVEGEVTPLIKNGFKKIFKQDIDDAVKSSITFDAQLKAAHDSPDQLKKVFVDLMTNPQQAGGKIVEKLNIPKGQLASAIGV